MLFVIKQGKIEYIRGAALGVCAVFAALALAALLGIFSAPDAGAAAVVNQGGGKVPGSVPTLPATLPPAPSSTSVPGSTATATAVPTACTAEFIDVPPGPDPPANPFYGYIHCLACRSIIGGYGDGTFRPNNSVTRGQLAKMAANSAGYNEAVPSSRQTFHDIAPDSPFWVFIERAFLHRVIGGYPCSNDPASPEPCDEQNRPYFRQNEPVTRQQVAKIVVIAKGLVTATAPGSVPSAEPTVPSVTYTFADVLPGNHFFVYIEALAGNGTISGYDCGGVNPATGTPEPCDAQNRKYYRPGNNMSRGQVSKVLSLTFFPECSPR